MAIPNFLIIGAARAGTTSLYEYLAEHPDVYMSPVKETRFFAAERLRDRIGTPAPGSVWDGTVTEWDDYVRLFSGATSERAIGEASPIYLAWSDSCAPAIHARLPHARIVACLRNPVDRAFSHYVHNVNLGLDGAADFEEALEIDGRSRHTCYLAQGLYAQRLRPYFDLFPREQIHVCLFDDLVERTADTLNDLFAFLGVGPSSQVRTEQRHNASIAQARLPMLRPLLRQVAQSEAIRSIARRLLPRSVRESASAIAQAPTRRLTLAPGTRHNLISYFRDDVIGLGDMLGRDLSHWLGASPATPRGRDGRGPRHRRPSGPTETD